MSLRSLQYLERCGFTISGEDGGFSNARDEEVKECILQWKATLRGEAL